MSNHNHVKSGAELSHDRKYRYSLWRLWQDDLPYVLFIGLNPSTADEHQDDPTIRRCIRFAQDWGFGGLYMANLFAIRATQPKTMMIHNDPIGESNDGTLLNLADNAGMIVCAWGAHGAYKERDKQVLELLSSFELKCLGTTSKGQPRHPLYIKADAELLLFGGVQ